MRNFQSFSGVSLPPEVRHDMPMIAISSASLLTLAPSVELLGEGVALFREEGDELSEAIVLSMLCF